jgi:hypothetical protein
MGDDIKMDFKAVEWEGLDKIDLASNWDMWCAVANMLLKHWVQ